MFTKEELYDELKNRPQWYSLRGMYAKYYIPFTLKPEDFESVTDLANKQDRTVEETADTIVKGLELELDQLAKKESK